MPDLVHSRLYDIREHPLARPYTTRIHIPYSNKESYDGLLTRVGNVVTFTGVSTFWQGDHNFDKVDEEIPYGYQPVGYATVMIESSGAFLCIDSTGAIHITGYMGQPSDNESSCFGVWLTGDLPPDADLSRDADNDKAKYISSHYSNKTSQTTIHFPYMSDSSTISIIRMGDFVYAGGWAFGSFPERHYHVINEVIPYGYRPVDNNMGLISLSALSGSLWVRTDGSIQSDGDARSNKWFQACGLWLTRDSARY